jgi:hypothetical protein
MSASAAVLDTAVMAKASRVFLSFMLVSSEGWLENGLKKC